MLFSTLFFLLIFSRYALGVDVKVAAGDEAVFSPTKPLPSPINSIAWKCISNNVVIVIEWDEDGFNAPNDRFSGITTLDKKTGEMKIKPVNFTHIGEYFFEVNSKDQGERFKLTVANRVPKPVIIIESTDNPDVVYLRCEYSETIIWRNSAGETLTGSKIYPKGESITIRKNGDPESFYTCSLRNDVSEETSDPIYEKDLFKGISDGLSAGAKAGIAIVVVIIIIAAIIGFAVFLYKSNKTFRDFVQRLPCFKGQRDDDVKPNDNQPAPKNENDEAKGEKDNPPDQIIKIDEAKGQEDNPTANTTVEAPKDTLTNENGDANNPGKENQVGVELKKTAEGQRDDETKASENTPLMGEKEGVNEEAEL